MRRFFLLTLVMTCAALVGFGALATAANRSFKTSTTLIKTATGIAGQLSSPKAACLKGRSLKVGYLGIYGPASVHTDSKGRWSWNYRTPESGWKAVASVYPKVLSSVPGQKRTCRAGSRERTF